MTPSASSSDERPRSRKSVLFCLECDHESLVDGDWLVRRERGAVVYRCPVCRTPIASRPANDATGAAAARWTSLYADWVEQWTTWYRRATPSF